MSVFLMFCLKIEKNEVKKIVLLTDLFFSSSQKLDSRTKSNKPELHSESPNERASWVLLHLPVPLDLSEVLSTS